MFYSLAFILLGARKPTNRTRFESSSSFVGFLCLSALLFCFFCHFPNRWLVFVSNVSVVFNLVSSIIRSFTETHTHTQIQLQSQYISVMSYHLISSFRFVSFFTTFLLYTVWSFYTFE